MKIAKWLKRLPTDLAFPGSSPASRRNLPDRNRSSISLNLIYLYKPTYIHTNSRLLHFIQMGFRSSIAHSHSLLPTQRPDTTEILLKSRVIHHPINWERLAVTRDICSFCIFRDHIRHYHIKLRRLAAAKSPRFCYCQTSGNSIFSEFMLLPDVWQ